MDDPEERSFYQDGYSICRARGNTRQNPNIGLLFVKFDGRTLRMRISAVLLPTIRAFPPGR